MQQQKIKPEISRWSLRFQPNRQRHIHPPRAEPPSSFQPAGIDASPQPQVHFAQPSDIRPTQSGNSGATLANTTRTMLHAVYRNCYGFLLHHCDGPAAWDVARLLLACLLCMANDRACGL
ncbi:hypothetical protein IQ06DRAFT_69433 [Phaeosphaeriaceae sp. SRC1lsM3a]|nr:hypothetical protein IQ06DRAFT_69433 [Stagonospora sp. SRC1lsM3a]